MNTIPRTLGKYELHEQLGRGNVGEVWKGYDSQLRRDVAIKIIHTDRQSDTTFMARFMSEGHALTEIHHANIVPIRDVNIVHPPHFQETTAYIVSDYIEGFTLSEYITALLSRGILPSLEQIVYLFTSLGVAIDYAHQRGLVHGNIKPNNILLNRRKNTSFAAGEPMLADLGLYQILGSTESVATPQYMSPEQAKGLPATNRSDIYALGVILYELCTGVQPFHDESSVMVMMQQIDAAPKSPSILNPTLPPALSEVILRALAKDTAARYPLASLLATAIADACSQSVPLSTSLDRSLQEEEIFSSHYPYASSPSDQGNTRPHSKLSSPSGFGTTQPHSRLSSHAGGTTQPHSRLSSHARGTTQPHSKLSSPSGFGTTQSQPRLSSHPSSPFSSEPETRSAPLPALSPQQQHAPAHQPTTTAPKNSSSSTTASIKLSQLSQTRVTSAYTTALSSLDAPSDRQMTSASPKIVQRPSTGVPVYTVVTALLLLLLVIGSAIGSSLFFQAHQPVAGQSTAPGHAFFQDDALGHNDLLRLELQNVPTPPEGQNYVAWLQTISRPVLLGSLPLHDHTISYLYPGDTNHTNLLSTVQGLSVTLEYKANTPLIPSNYLVYQATLDTTAFPYIKNILYATPTLPNNQCVIASLIETIKSLNDKAGSIADTLPSKSDNALVQRQATRILELVEGTAFAQSSGDLPQQDAPQLNTSLGLLSSPDRSGYLDTLAQQLDQLKQRIPHDSTMLQHVQNVKYAITDLQTWIQTIRGYALQLLKAPDLNDPSLVPVAFQLKKLAADAYTGRTLPPNTGPQSTPGSAGAYQAYVESQYLATLTLEKK